MRILKYFLICALFLLAGCSALIPQNAQVWSGRFSVTSRGAEAVDRHSGSFRLTVSPDRSSLAIFGPLGAQVAVIEETQNHCELIQSGKTTLSTQGSEALMSQLIGVPLSVENLVALLSGQKVEIKDNPGLWMVRTESGDGKTPSRISAKGEIPSRGTEILLVILPKREQ